MNRQIIYVSGYPKSGTTYLTRLLGDVLNSPTGGCTPSEDKNEVATEGQDRPGPYVVRKGHFVLIDDNSIGAVVPHPHRLAWQRLTDERIVFLIRDPRDICVSGAYHWNCSVGEFLERMIAGSVARCGRWDRYVDKWLATIHEAGAGKGQWTWVTYENLLMDIQFYLWLPCSVIGVNVDFAENVDEIIERQSFANRKAQIGNNEQELRRNNMRKGIVGDWCNHFDKGMNERIWSEFGWVMERLGYE